MGVVVEANGPVRQKDEGNKEKQNRGQKSK